MAKNQEKEICGVEMPPISDFLNETQRDGTELCADKVFRETYSWLQSNNCENAVGKQLVEQYAMSVSRWIHCEQQISKYGYIAKHPTTGAAMASPYVSMAQTYMKQVIALRNEINQLIANYRPPFADYPQEVVYGE